MPVSFRGPQRADDEGERQGSTPIKYAVKRQCNRKILSVANALGRLALTSPLSSADLCPKTREPTSASEPQTKCGSRETRRGKILGIGYAGIGVRKTAAARCHGRMKRDEKEGYGSTFTPSASSNSTMTPVSSV